MDPLRIDIPVDIGGLEQRFAQLGGEELDRALVAGLLAAGEQAAHEVRVDAADRLASRTGNLLSSIGAWPEPEAQDATVRVGVPDDAPVAPYAWILTETDRRIVPHGHPYLAIPIGINRTPAGVGGNLFASPRDIPDAVWRGRTVGLLVGERYEPLFALTPEVYVFGRGALESGVARAEPGLAALVAEVAFEQLLRAA